MRLRHNGLHRTLRPADVVVQLRYALIQCLPNLERPNLHASTINSVWPAEMVRFASGAGRVSSSTSKPSFFVSFLPHPPPHVRRLRYRLCEKTAVDSAQSVPSSDFGRCQETSLIQSRLFAASARPGHSDDSCRKVDCLTKSENVVGGQALFSGIGTRGQSHG